MRLVRERRLVLAAVPALLLLAAPAGARKFQMSGSWVIRNGREFLPLQFAATQGTPMNVAHASMGNFTGAFGVPNKLPVPGLGGATASGSAPAALRVPRHRFVEDAMAAFLPSGTSTFAQITTNIGFDGPYASATLAKSGGPGSFTWCPTDPLCAAGGGMLATDPPRGIGGRSGRVIYRAGANRFGGAMQMGLRRGGVYSWIFNLFPAQIGQAVAFGAGSAPRALAPGGLGSADQPETEKLYLPAGFVTQPLTIMWGELIKHPGPKLTTMLGLTNTKAGPLLTIKIGTTPMGLKFGQKTSNYGFAHTTGSVFAEQTLGTGGDDFFSFMGYDKRTALGAGTIQAVAGGLSFRITARNNTPYATMHRVRMTLGAPIPSLSPGGFAAAGALVLLAAGYGLRRRGVHGIPRERGDTPRA